MRLRWKIVITIALAALAVWFNDVVIHTPPPPELHARAVEKCEALPVWYAQYNEEYFHNRLPKDTVVDYGETGSGNIAMTVRMYDGRFHIGFNEDYASAPRVAHLFLLHEMCHVKTYDEKDQSNEGHGKMWRACMLELDMEGANRALLIDAYDIRYN